MTIDLKTVKHISKLSRISIDDNKAKKLSDDLNSIFKFLKPKGVAVVIDASHQCMSTRGIHKTESSTVTSSMRGIFKENPTTRNEFLNFIRLPK